MDDALPLENVKTLIEDETVKVEVIEEIENTPQYGDDEVAVKLEYAEDPPPTAAVAPTPKKTRRLPSILQKRAKRPKISNGAQAGRTSSTLMSAAQFQSNSPSAQDVNLASRILPMPRRNGVPSALDGSPQQKRIILPKPRAAIQGIAIGNPVKIKVNGVRKTSTDSDKSDKIASTALHPQLSQPVITSPPELEVKTPDPREKMRPGEDSSLKVTGLMKISGTDHWNFKWDLTGREYCSRCNKIHNVDEKAVDDDEGGFHIGNSVAKSHKCVVDTCGICGMELTGDSEQLRLRHILHCEKEEIETVRGKALYIADKGKERRQCRICNEDFSNMMPSVEYSYFRRHCASHVIPDHIDGQKFFYRCFYCPERYKSKMTYVNHLFYHYQNGVHCADCHFLSHEEGEMFLHKICHGRATCPSCQG
ncbi:Oidioi.mRNA.OKI2018_I69.chr2.g6218.t1.cds [Oikopleura dioica]|uniref:Oidioi.mRNA.OKI2018_I69.chr2.g6218.t1.cds n=1 Tax=Oikopleura dioica TaxID=34765 RepID=A0ABN7T2A4_OIKDI|nr:Oidioi.mRNA.OKI2018_I69.chr2.g6218.t1.cds [Oikopleura dioica]